MRLIKKVLMLVIILVFIVSALIAYKGYSMYKAAIDDISLDTKIIQLRQRKSYVIFEDLPEDYVNAVIDVEDSRFYDHNGIDIISILRAIVNNIKAGRIVEGRKFYYATTC